MDSSSDVRLNILVVSYRRGDLLARALESVDAFAPGAELLIWDNQSDGSRSIAEEVAPRWPHHTWTFSDTNVGFAAAVNRLAAMCTGDFLLLNPDAQLAAPVSRLVAALVEDTSLAAVAPLIDAPGLRAWDNTRSRPGVAHHIVEYAGYGDRLRGSRWSARYAELPREVGYASGACLLIRRAAWEDVGPFDEQFWVYSEELDWATRAAARGWRIGLVPWIGARHAAGGTVSDSVVRAATSARLLYGSQVKYLRKHHGALGAASFGVAAAIVRALAPLRHAARRVRALNARSSG